MKLLIQIVENHVVDNKLYLICFSLLENATLEILSPPPPAPSPLPITFVVCTAGLTRTLYSYILVVVAVVDTELELTVHQMSLVASAVDVVQPDGNCLGGRYEASSIHNNGAMTVAHHPADNHGI